MSNTLRTPESYLDEVARENNFLLELDKFKKDTHYRANLLHIITEAMRRMCEDAFKAQKDICADRAEFEIFDNAGGLTSGKVLSNGHSTIAINKSSIKNAPSPFEIDNQNKN